MAKTKVQEYDSTAGNNSDIDGIDIAENCAAANMNNALRKLMAHIKAALSGSDDSIITGTSGTTDNLLKWNGDGDAVDSGFAVLDEDDFASDSATGVPTQQSVKAWVEGKATGADAGFVTGTAGTENYLAKWNGDGDLVDAGVEVLDEDNMASDSAAAVPTQQSVKAYVDTYAMGTVVVPKTTTTAVANVDISVPAGCNRLEIDILDIVPVTDDVSLYLQCGNSGVDSGASDYAYGYTTLGGSTGTSSGDTKILVQPSSGSDTGENQGGTISVLGPRDSGITTKFVWNTAQEKSDGVFYTITGSARRNTAQDDDTVRILFSSGNIETITYTVRSFTD
jgi:hypothetical protein